MKKFVLPFVLSLLSCTIENYQNNYEIIDGDDLLLNGQITHLYGIDAMEYTQTCLDAKNNEYACGEMAKEYLQSLISPKTVCVFKYIDTRDRHVSECYNPDTKISINAQMILNGFAVPKMEFLYVSELENAKKNKRGIHQGRYLVPPVYRKNIIRSN